MGGPKKAVMASTVITNEKSLFTIVRDGRSAVVVCNCVFIYFFIVL